MTTKKRKIKPSKRNEGKYEDIFNRQYKDTNKVLHHKQKP